MTAPQGLAATAAEQDSRGTNDMTRSYYRPIAQTDPCRPEGARTLAGGWAWFDRAEHLTREGSSLVAADDIPADILERLTAPRAAMAGLEFSAPCLMGILNVTPDSFSDGGKFIAPDAALAQAQAMADAGAHMIDVGGESTRPGALPVAEADEIARTAPVIAAIRGHSDLPISIDTRKTAVAQAAIGAGANLINDVSGFTFDPALAPYCAEAGLPVCVMHAQGDPQTMQHAPRYDDVTLDVYDFLEARIDALVAEGVARAQIIVDPGIGFGKTQAHNLTLLSRLSIFHGLGCPILLGASRKKFIGTIGGTPDAADRMPGSVAVALAGIAQGVQIIRAHDVDATRAAIALWRAATSGLA
ncbi:dihydropteroate synthase [Roseovarius nanhaiticus]|uniref:Dihydropteroate synthase n=2 Tax=Roseovarius nanhaiticus TaxID=573024 RepID=A0A1N7ETG1_9RHOB|nr:dihydropteroate synthase [Roseovarius nanhaiticus]SIR91408.1 dihydropteroate synthase [Roseovarius nanhaiticus]